MSPSALGVFCRSALGVFPRSSLGVRGCEGCSIDPNVDTQLELTFAGVNAGKCAGCYEDPGAGGVAWDMQSVAIDGTYTLDYFATLNGPTRYRYRKNYGGDTTVFGVVDTYVGDPVTCAPGQIDQNNLDLIEPIIDLIVGPNCEIYEVRISEIVDDSAQGFVAKAFEYSKATPDKYLGDAVANTLSCAWEILSSTGTATASKPTP